MPWPLSCAATGSMSILSMPLRWTTIPVRNSPNRLRLPEAARWWAAHLLPVNPHDAERVLNLVHENQIQLKPAVPPWS